MKISNFKVLDNNGLKLAEIDVETGIFFWKKKIRKQIARSIGGYWYFVDSGEYTPAYQAEEAERAYKAQIALTALKNKVIS